MNFLHPQTFDRPGAALKKKFQLRLEEGERTILLGAGNGQHSCSLLKQGGSVLFVQLPAFPKKMRLL
jgi:hypothetical protein